MLIRMWVMCQSINGFILAKKRLPRGLRYRKCNELTRRAKLRPNRVTMTSAGTAATTSLTSRVTIDQKGI